MEYVRYSYRQLAKRYLSPGDQRGPRRSCNSLEAQVNVAVKSGCAKRALQE